MTDVLAAVEGGGFVDFGRLFKPEEGRMGVTVTFIAILELVREGLLDLVQTEPYGPLHVRAAQSPRLRAVPDDESQDEGTA
jgi:segregation and condensation protein A